jgi:cell division septum initiation protein DivIVA
MQTQILSMQGNIEQLSEYARELEQKVEELRNDLHDADNINSKLIKQLTELREFVNRLAHTEKIPQWIKKEANQLEKED